MNNLWNWFKMLLTGMGMGAANVVPGVSGGTIAFITGIYERLVGSINNFDAKALKLLFSMKFKELWKHIDGNFLLAIMLGIGIATLSLAKLMLVLLHGYPVQTWAFFFGLIIASSCLILNSLKGIKGWDWLWIAVGLVLGAAVCELSPMQTPDDLWFIFLCGAVSICAMILPGLSGSFILLVMGKYEYIMRAIDGCAHFRPESFLILVVFIAGCAVGILAFAKLLHWLLDRWNRQTLVLLCGFVFGSLVKVWPWADKAALAEAGLPTTGCPLLGQACLWMVIGTLIVCGIEFAGNLAKTRKK